ncbi:MAG TPA: DUF4386 domain-containing protein [Chitinophagaceae bacterium]|nr:DUF4386 domain-containing protein [Chitinophagaceae bacterium]
MQSYNLLNQEEKVAQPPVRFAFTIGRTTGIVLLLQLITALTLPFILTKPITLGSPAFLTAVAEHSSQIRMAVLLSFVGAALTVYLGITVFRGLQLYSKSAALLFLVVCTVSCILDVVHASTILSMLSFSNAFVTSGAPNAEVYQVAGIAVASARRSAHSTQLIAIGAWMFVFYISLLRFKLIPRVLAVMGIIGIALQFIGVTAMMLLGYRLIGEMAMPMLPIQITVAVWLIFKGFNDHPPKFVAISNIK